MGNVNTEFTPGQTWADNNEKHISAHGGGVLKHEDVFYWYGEDNTKGYLNHVGVSCYSSVDLYNWKNEGVVLKQEYLPTELQGEFGGRIERPKVIYNAKTNKFVMWMHAERKGYAFSSAGVAISDNPTGPFQFLFCDRPVWFEQESGFDAHTNERELGNSFRDMNLFVDDRDLNGDGVNDAYVIYSSEGNWTMYFVRLNEEYTWVDLPKDDSRVRPQCQKEHLGEVWSRQFVRKMREAPALFKHKESYYVITSACTGWKPNQAQYAVSGHPLGEYIVMGDPCIGDFHKTTFDSQSTWVLPLDESNGTYIYMGDRWTPENLGDSRYVWLPLTVREDRKIAIHWHDRWVLKDVENR